MLRHANPLEPAETDVRIENNQTVELRSPDGSANVYMLLAGMAVAARYGLEHPDALKVAEALYVHADASKVKGLEQLPASCFESADGLEKDRARYEDAGVFPAGLIDSIIARLKAFDDLNLSERLMGDSEALKALVSEHLHCG